MMINSAANSIAGLLSMFNNAASPLARGRS
jgi:hypothetical protein